MKGAQHVKKITRMGNSINAGWSNCGLCHLPPPEQIQSATSTLNRYTPEYVREANKALIESRHPDAERLVGIGLRLQKAIDSLDSWANKNPEENK